MDFNALQRKLFELDPTDPREDLAKLQAQAQGTGAVTGNVPTTRNYLEESAVIKEGSLTLDKDYSIAEFAALAGIVSPINEGAAWDAFKHGKANYNKLNALNPGSTSNTTVSKISKVDKLAKPGTPTQKESNLLDPKLTSKLLPHEDQLKTIFSSARLRVKFEEFLNLHAPRKEETMEANKKTELPKPRDPNWRDMQAIRQSGAMGAHKDKKRDAKLGKEKHKKDYATESIKEMLYRKLNESK
jgi:hypothetical protein